MSDPRCEAERERVSAFVDDRLAGRELLELEEHLEACEECRRFEAALRRFKELLPAVEVFRPLRQPPPGFAAAVAARAAREGASAAVPFPAPRARRPYAAWAGFAAAAAAAALVFALAGQRVIGVREQVPAVAEDPRPKAFQVATMDDWFREHATFARDATLLGPAEEVEFASFDASGAGEP